MKNILRSVKKIISDFNFPTRVGWRAVLVGAVFGVGIFVLAPKINDPSEYAKENIACKGTGCAIAEPKKVTHLKTPKSVKAIYMTSWVAGTTDWRKSLVDFIDSSELNAVVVDVKDYTGRISFEISDSEIVASGAPEKRIADIANFIKILHDKNIYAIARISVFQDAFLVKLRPDLAVKTKEGGIWKDFKGISWLDQCSKDVWDYTIKIAREAELAGFDELNFDYIRFPSDGNMKNIAYPFCGDFGSLASKSLEAKLPSKADMLEQFFKYLSDNLRDVGVPLSADLFGMVTVNTDDLNIGQVLERAAPYFDYIAPMVYPSHYPKGYNGYKNPADHPYEIVYKGMKTASDRLIAASSTPEKLRPWLQDFDLGATYTAEMVNKQKQAVYDAGLQSWMSWDASNKYTKEAY
ncbi:MAG: putative glycoside hydrolase [Patescibacteria group bacterium]